MLKIALCFTGVIGIQMLEADNVSFGMKAQSGFFLVSFTSLWIVNWCVLKSEREICQLSNRLFRFEERHDKCFRDHWNGSPEMVLKIARLFDFIGTTTSVVTYIIYVAQIWVQPCFPGNFGYKFYSECRLMPKWMTVLDDCFLGLVIKILLVTFSSTCAIFLFSTFTIVVVQFTFVFSFCYRNYLIYLQNAMKTFTRHGWILHKERKHLLVYNQIKLLLIQHNSIHQSLIVVILVNQAMFVVTVALFLLIGMYSKLETSQKLLFVVVGLDAILVVVVVLGFLGLVYSSSMETLKIAKEIPSLRKHLWTKRYIRSWTPLKIGFGSVNYIDQLTGLVCFDFSVNQTVNLLMMDRRH